MDAAEWTKLRAKYRQFKVVGEGDLEKATAGPWQVICELGLNDPATQEHPSPFGFRMVDYRGTRFLLGRGEADTLADKDAQIERIAKERADALEAAILANDTLSKARNMLKPIQTFSKPTRELMVELIGRLSNLLKVSG